jgi:hypothetical protein
VPAAESSGGVITAGFFMRCYNPAMGVEPSKTELPKSRRRWFQFSLRTQLIVVTLFAVACWIVVGDIQIKNRRKDFIESGAVIGVVIKRDGGGVAFLIRRWLGDLWYTSDVLP